MRMRKKKNLLPRMERCAAKLIADPEARRGAWRELLPSAREYGGGRCGIAGAFCGMAFMAAADLFFRIS